ncbi:MAG: alternative ribosome rescue aminoacyl-tRNA hydrolase ArfB [Dokdonia donghaensis]|nr:alternative ribosome rescue aminoacyl-tRNA hydrolase ArfB [Dokdonia donghaensis]
MHREQLLQELSFKASKSSGPGGQHANKTSSRIELNWSLPETLAFTEEEIVRLTDKLAHRLTKEGVLQLASQASRSQHKNKEDVIKRFFSLLEVAIQVPKVRKKKRPSKLAKLKRLKAKKEQSEKKANRKRPDF